MRALRYRFHAIAARELAEAHRARLLVAAVPRALRKRLHRARVARRVEVSRVQLREVKVAERAVAVRDERGTEDDGDARPLTARGRGSGRRLGALEKDAVAGRALGVSRALIQRRGGDVHAPSAVVAPHGLHLTL